MSFREKPPAKAQGCIRPLRRLFLLPLPLLLACQPHPRDPADSARADLTVIDVSAPLYQPADGARYLANEAAMCKAWVLDKTQVESFFRLSKPLREGERHGYDWLPCSIKGRLRARGRDWDFEINAAGTSTWISGEEVASFGCSQAQCEPLVILMPDTTGR